MRSARASKQNIPKFCNRRWNFLCSLCLLIFTSLALSCWALLNTQKKFIHRVSLQSVLKSSLLKDSPMDAAFHSFRNDTVPQEPGVLYQDSVWQILYEGIHNKLRIFFYFHYLVFNICIMEVPGGSSWDQCPIVLSHAWKHGQRRGAYHLNRWAG